MSKLEFAGIDVSAKELVMARLGTAKQQIFANDRRGHRALVKSLKAPGSKVRVCLEATGVYSLDVALALDKARGIEVMVANPRAVKDFAGAMMSRSKTDALDSVVLAQYAARMPFVPFAAPSPAAYKLRGIARRIAVLKDTVVAEKNRLHAELASELGGTGGDIRVHIRFLEGRIEMLTRKAIRLIEKDEELSARHQRLVSVKGIAAASAIQILAELSLLPGGMDKRQWTAHAGLDPKHFDSGSSVHKQAHISKAGNRHLRRALFMPALVAIQHEPSVKEYYAHLLRKGKRPLQAIVAVMRKLLCAIWGMFRNGQPFDGNRFYNLSIAAS